MNVNKKQLEYRIDQILWSIRNDTFEAPKLDLRTVYYPGEAGSELKPSWSVVDSVPLDVVENHLEQLIDEIKKK